jgi:hypothetical protein
MHDDAPRTKEAVTLVPFGYEGTKIPATAMPLRDGCSTIPSHDTIVINVAKKELQGKLGQYFSYGSCIFIAKTLEEGVITAWRVLLSDGVVYTSDALPKSFLN